MAKPKKIAYTLIPNGEPWTAMYAMLRTLIDRDHEELTNARIALAWCTSWSPDVDGRATLGKCKRASDLDRELAPYDFVLLFDAEWWQDASTTDGQRLALMDHELSHATVVLDDVGEPQRDERDRVVYRLRKHDIEEFEGTVRRHGIYKREIVQFAAALRHGKQMSLLGEVESLAADPNYQDALDRLRPDPAKGVDSVEISHGGRTVTLAPRKRQARA